MIERELPGARAVFTTREGGVSEGPYRSLNLGILTDDEPERVRVNRDRVADHCDLAPSAIAMGWQVHGTDIAVWDGPPPPGEGGFAAPEAELSKVDGHTTAATDLGLLVLVADCLPVALASADRLTVLHCGWRGLAGGIVEEAMPAFGGAQVSAVVGPGIGACCYEVGDEVLDAFAGVPGAAAGRMLDLRVVAEHELRSAGVGDVHHVDLCTSCREDLFFSHRRDRGVTGRQGLVAWRAS